MVDTMRTARSTSIWSGNIPSRWRAERPRSRDNQDTGGGSVRVLGGILRPPGLPPYTDAITPAQRGTADPIQVSQNSRISILNNFPPLSLPSIHDPWWYNYTAAHCQVPPHPNHSRASISTSQLWEEARDYHHTSLNISWYWVKSDTEQAAGESKLVAGSEYKSISI